MLHFIYKLNQLYCGGVGLTFFIKQTFECSTFFPGIIRLIKLCEPKSVVLAYGKRTIMQRLQLKLMDCLKIKCFVPEIGETCVINVPIKIPRNAMLYLEQTKNIKKYCPHSPHPNRRPRMTGVLLIRNNHIAQMTIDDALRVLVLNYEPLYYKYRVEFNFHDTDPNWETINKLFIILKHKLSQWNVLIRNDRTITVEDVEVKLVKNRRDITQTLLSVTWRDNNEDICFYILHILENLS